MIDKIICVYWLFIYTLLPYGFNFSINTTIMTASFIHSTLVSAYSALLISHYGIDLYRENLFEEIIIVKTSMWYFIYDLLLLLVRDRDIIYILHHLCAIINFIIIINYNYGISSCILILFFGEITNPFRLAKQMIFNHNKSLYKIYNFIFSWLFIIVRIPIMTYYYILIHKDLYSKIDDLSVKYSLYSTTSIGLLGGYYWSYLLIKKKLNY